MAPPPPTNKLREHPVYGVPVPGPSGVPDPVVQAQKGAAAAPALGAGFEGVGQGVLRFNVHTDGDPNTAYALIDDVALA